MKRSTILLWAGVGAFILAAMVHPRRWLDDGLGSACIETVWLVVAGAGLGAAAAILRAWINGRRKPR